LPAEYLDVGYAVFLPEAAFEDVATEPGRRRALVKLFRRHQPSPPPGSWNPARDTVGEMGAAGSWSAFSDHHGP
jgi:hypothetical protein